MNAAIAQREMDLTAQMDVMDKTFESLGNDLEVAIAALDDVAFQSRPTKRPCG
jgi:hypothetical protein